MPLDPTRHADWEIAQAAEAGMKPVTPACPGRSASKTTS